LPNTKSAKKMMIVQERNRARNRPVLSRMRSFITRARAALTGGGDTAADAVKGAQKEIDLASKKGVIHSRNAARKKSRLMKKLALATKESK